MSASSLIFLPGGQRRSFSVGGLRYFGEDGQIHWENEETGEHGSMLPTRALNLARELGKQLLGANLEESAAKDPQDRKRIADTMSALETLAKEQQAQEPDTRAISDLLWLPGR